MTAKTAAKGESWANRRRLCHVRLQGQINKLDETYSRFVNFPRSAHDLKRAKGFQRYRKHYARVQYRNRVAEWGGR